MTPRISVLTPTRGRPDYVRRLVDSALTTAHGSIELVFYVDDDDPTRDELTLHDQTEVKLVLGERCVLSEAWNRCYADASADVLMQCGDDIIFRTDDWDDLILDRFNASVDKILFVHGRDGIQDANIGTHGFLHRRWVETVGYFVPPYFASDYNDAWLTEVADALGRRVYVPEVYTEHMHPVVGKGPLDQTHLERLERHRTQDCDKIWHDTADLRREDVRKLTNVITTTAAA